MIEDSFQAIEKWQNLKQLLIILVRVSILFCGRYFSAALVIPSETGAFFLVSAENIF